MGGRSSARSGVAGVGVGVGRHRYRHVGWKIVGNILLAWVTTLPAAALLAAVKTQRQLERVYRQAASALLEVQDLREVTGRRELYWRVSRSSETLTEAADRVWYATVKEG